MAEKVFVCWRRLIAVPMISKMRIGSECKRCRTLKIFNRMPAILNINATIKKKVMRPYQDAVFRKDCEMDELLDWAAGVTCSP